MTDQAQPVGDMGELVKRLREPRFMSDEDHARSPDAVLNQVQDFRSERREAATTIESLQSNVERLTRALETLEAAMKRDLGPGYAGVALAQAALSNTTQRGDS